MFVRIVAVVLAVLVAWAVFARSSDGAGHERTYVVRSGDTLWAIADRFYAGDPREGVWRLREQNGLEDGLIHPGQQLAVPSG
ncbi:MAG: LysM peptidoglycan-binding domain-containing protein [Thermoleophilia bacterium]|nr:LysM peptidoglycan-binding domain-containing protein [Thermoleophilia bacterium]